jgi:hypothetical protein
MRLFQRTILFILVLFSDVTMTGCTHLGPATIAMDRFDYNAAIADSWKQKTLLNIVKFRYMDLPVFMDVPSIVSGYSVQSSINANGTISSERAVQGNFAALGGQVIYTDRPTITYAPLTGEKFLRSLITPIDPKNIFFLLQSGYAADFVLGMAVESLNGVRNRSAVGGVMRKADPEFTRALELLRDVQTAGAFGMRVEEDKAKGSTGVVFFRRDDVPADIVEKQLEIRRLLKLPPDLQRLVLTYAPTRGAENELAVNSRSMFQIMQAFASWTCPQPTLKTAAPGPRARRRLRPKAVPACGFIAARRSRPMRLSRCGIATIGFGWTMATCKPNARSRSW